MENKGENSTLVKLDQESPRTQEQHQLRKQGENQQKMSVQRIKKVVQENPKKIASGVFSIGFLAYIATFIFTITPKITFQNEQFNYHVYCPVAYEILNKHKNLSSSEINLLKTHFPDLDLNQVINKDELLNSSLNSTYFVRMMDGYDLSNNESQLALYYCGFLKKWNGKCEDAEYICSSPGAIFENQAYKATTVYWINDIQDLSKYSNLSFPNSLPEDNKCFSKNPLEKCKLSAKKSDCSSWTYLDPTQETNQNMKKVQIEKKNIPVSTHLHGLEIRPAFDGNPLSWFDNHRNVGIGYLTADSDYFSSSQTQFEQQFAKAYFKQFLCNDCSSVSYKVNVYPNVQQPGILWYHDHAMSNTKFNVQSGLYGFYLIRNSEQQKNLPSREFESYLFLGTGKKEVYCSNCTDSFLPSTIQFNNKNTYRFKIINGHFRRTFSGIHFLDQFNNKIKFRIVGTDSAVRKSSTQLMTDFDLASAERVDLIISFSSLNFYPEKQTTVFIKDSSDGFFFQFNVYKIGNNVPHQSVSHVSDTGSPFFNFTEIPQENIAKKRMRPLIHVPDFSAFGINGHTEFHKGASENPAIGTVEDWFLINTMGFGHPIHVHLIQYQHIQQYTLKTIPQKCTLYQIDFFRKNHLSCSVKFQINANMTQTCLRIQKLSKSEYQKCFKDFKNQDIFDQNKISGINVLEQNTDNQQYSNSNCKQSKYKYICENITSEIPNYQRGYKQVSFVKGYRVSVIRIRWAKSHMSHEEFKNAQTNLSIPFFTVDQNTLTEYPGFIYHCHILPHEDNEMMRPIMMQQHPNRRHQSNWNETAVSQRNDKNCKKSVFRRKQSLHPPNDLRRVR